MCTESADLVDIKSKAEDGFIQALTGGTAAIWTGKMGDSHYLLLITFHNLTGATDDTMEELWTWSAGGNIQYIVLYQFYFNIWFCTKCVSPPDNRSISFNKFGYTYKNWGTTPTYDVTKNCMEKSTAGTWKPDTCSTKKY